MQKYKGTPTAIKTMIVKEYEEKGISLRKLSATYGIAHTSIYNWVKTSRTRGIQALGQLEQYNMGRPKKKTLDEMTELERLRYENEYLRAENALLKKVRALVEEREARLKEIGRKPSKN